MLSNAYFLANFRFDTAENEPAKNLQQFCKNFKIFFGRRRLKKRSEKTENARSKRKHRKGRGQAAAKKRSPLLRMWKRGRARRAKVHACGAQMNRELQEISRECEGGLQIKEKTREP